MKVLNNLDSLNGVLDGSSAVNDNTRKGINYISATLASSAKWENNKGYPTTWKANTTLTPVDGMTISLKMPSAGHDYGVFLSLDNGTNYYPIGLSPCTNTRLTTHFGNGSTILLQYSSTWQINDLYAVAGAASRSNIVGGWKIVSSYLDGNTVSQIREENGRVYAGTNGISPYTIIALDKDGKYQSLITTATTGTGTNKTINTSAKFKMEPVIRYYNANNTNTNGNLVASTYALYSAYCAVDTRYSHNHTVTFTTNTPLYIECTVDSDGFWSPTSTCITQTLTSGKYYIFLGNTYSTEYQISLSPSHPVYYYNGTTLLDYTSQASVKYATNSGTATTATNAYVGNLLNHSYYNSGNVPYYDRAYIDAINANRSAFFPGDKVTIERSTDGGSTWTTIGTDVYNNAVRQSIFSMTRASSVAMGSGTVTTNWQLRITLNFPASDWYCSLDRLFIFMSSGGHSVTCTLDASTYGAQTTYSNIFADKAISGWSGPNMISFGGNYSAWGTNSSSHKYNLRLTFKVTAVNANYSTTSPTFNDIRFYGPNYWGAAGQPRYNGHLYTWDYIKNVIFPADVKGATVTSTGALTAGSISTSGNITASSGDILLTKNANDSGQQVKWSLGSNDYARVYGAATASNAGYLEIATADDSNEPIYARQYSGNFATVTRTANILDASGNTSFPGTLTANKIDATKLDGAIKNGVTATTQSAGDNSTKVATTAYVDSAITALPEPMIFKGSLGTGGTITTLPAASASNEGFTYKVITAGTYAGQAAKVGDTFISDGSAWVLIPSGDEPSGTVTSVKIQATSPIAIDSDTAITTSGTRTLSHANSGVTAGTYKSVTVNATGHVTAGSNPTTLSGYGITDAKIASGVITLGSNTITPLTASSTLDATKLSGTIPSGCYTDTKNTAGSTDSSSKLFLVGATSQAANPQTYSQDTVYAGTDGHIYSNSKQVVNLSDDQDLTNKTYEGYTLAAACGKDYDEVITAGGSSNLATSEAVVDYLASNGYGPTNVYVGTQTPASPDIVLWMNPNNPMVAKNGLYVGNKIYLEGAPLFWYEEY